MGGRREGPLQKEGKECHTQQAWLQAELKTQETPLGLGVPTSCSDGTEEGDVGPI